MDVESFEARVVARVSRVNDEAARLASDEDIVTLRGLIPGDNTVMPKPGIQIFIEGLEAAVTNVIISSQGT